MMGWVKRRNGYCYYTKVTVGGRRRSICLYRNGVATDIGDEFDRLLSTLVRPAAARQRLTKRRVDAMGEIPLFARQNTELELDQESDGNGDVANRAAERKNVVS